MKTQQKVMSWFRHVSEVRVLRAGGPWTTKSGGELSVFFAFTLGELTENFFRYSEEELRRLPQDIRGLRIYGVRGIPKGRIGGTEFHRIREELVMVLEGKVRWECEDVLGIKVSWNLGRGDGLWMPPYILHTYEALEDGSDLLVLANTLFDPEDPRSYDSYPYHEFVKLQEEYRERFRY